MNFRACSSGQIMRLWAVLFCAAISLTPSTSVVAQTYGAQQAVRRSVDNLGGAAPGASEPAGAPGGSAVSFQRDVLPILRANCHGCHRPDKASGGLDMTAFVNLLGVGESGAPAIVPGSPDESYVVAMITPRGGEAAMPQGKRPLSATQIATIRRWIEEGAVDDTPPGATNDGYRVGRSAPSEYAESASPEYAQSAPSTSGMIDTTYVSPTAIGVVVIRPAQIMSAPIAELLPIEVLTAAGQEYLGFDPASIEEIVLFVGQINMLQPAETEIGVTFKFTSPFRASSIKREIRAHAQLSEFAGKRYLQSMHPVMPSFYGPDNRTLVVTRDAALRKLVETRDQAKTGPLIDRLSSVPAGSDLYVALDLASLRPFLEMGMAQAKASGKVPPQGEKFLELPKLISVAELTLNLTGAGPMSLVVHATDEAAAQQIETLLNEASNNPTVGPPDRYAAETNPVAQAITQYVERFSQPFRPQLNGTSVTLFRVEAQSAAHQQLASLAVFGIGAGMQALQAARTAAESAATASAPESLEGGESFDPAQSTESSVPAGYPRR
jgi:mono/diheme cytochrome c family protein